ncbi:MAG: RNA polymerase subunit sigma, partial [Clostridiales bacterium]
LRNNLIIENVEYIKGVVCNTTKKFGNIESTDEYSIGLQGFNEAIDCYNPKKNDNFYNFSSMIIKRRLINYYNSTNRQKNVILFSDLEGDNTEGTDYIEEKNINKDDEDIFRLELEEFKEKLLEFNITLKNLVELSPKRKDAKHLCTKMAMFVAKNELFFSNLERKKTLPYNELIRHFGINKKTVERNRKLIIATAIIYGNGFQMLRDFIKDDLSGGQ